MDDELEEVSKHTLPVGMLDILIKYRNSIRNSIWESEDQSRFDELMNNATNGNSNNYGNADKCFFVIAIASNYYNHMQLSEYINRAIAKYHDVERTVGGPYSSDIDLQHATFMTKYVPVSVVSEDDYLRNIVATISQLNDFKTDFVNAISRKGIY